MGRVVGRRRPPEPVRLAWFSVWLVFLAYPVGDLVRGRIDGAGAVAAWVGLGLFVVLYEVLVLRHPWGSPSASGRRPISVLVAFAVLAIGLAFGFGANWIGIFIYVSVALGANLAPRTALVAVVANAALALIASIAADVGASNVAFFPFMTLMMGMMIIGWRRTMTLVTELRAAREEVARLAVTGERLRFARDLHDLLGHSLSVIVLKSELARRLVDRDSQAAGVEVKQIELVARQALTEIREAVTATEPRTWPRSWTRPARP
ncbi:MAG: sensor histidine kinase [Acidimicrobiales bacterium]